jgi:MFS family permease
MVSSQPYLTAVTSPEERPLAFALVISLRPLGAMIGSLLGGLLPGLFAGWGGVFGSSLIDPRPYGMALAVGLLVYVPVFWVLRLLPSTPQQEDAPRKEAPLAACLTHPVPRRRALRPGQGELRARGRPWACWRR